MFPPLLCLVLLFGLVPCFPLGVFPLPLLTLKKRLYLREQDTGKGLYLVIDKSYRNIFPTLFRCFWRLPLDFNSFPNILRPEFPMCSTPVCGILCGQKQSLAGAIPAGLCGILGIPLFHSGNNTKSPEATPRRGMP